MTVGDGVPQLGQNAEPEGISARHEGQVSWVVTARKIRPPSARCNGGAVGDAMRPHHYLPAMLAVRIVLGLALAYVALVLLAWRFQERLAFPAPRAPLPDPKRVGVANGEKIEGTMENGTRLVGWYLASTALHRPSPPSTALKYHPTSLVPSSIVTSTFSPFATPTASCRRRWGRMSRRPRRDRSSWS